VSLEPRETVVSDSIIDLMVAVSEGGPSHVRRIGITGNKGTREKVIRRELSVREGDLFRRSSLVRSQGDVMRLGIFNEVIPDFTAAESADVDLVFKITEKQVGTASAGARLHERDGSDRLPRDRPQQRARQWAAVVAAPRAWWQARAGLPDQFHRAVVP
jgi:outer membrane protein assembly factor BamA